MPGKSFESQPVPFKTNPCRIELLTSSQRSSGPSLSTRSTSPILSFPTNDYGADEYTSLLAASYRDADDDLNVPCAQPEYLKRELNVDRLNRIHHWLWTVGRPMPPRALHHQKLLGREPVLTERIDMHLVWSEHRIFLKPIPRYLLEPHFWADHLSCEDNCYYSHSLQSPIEERQFCDAQRLRRCGLGFLMSFVALISYESDFHMAQDMHLLPKELKWPDWKTFVAELLSIDTVYSQVNKRFIYGELRLNRLNLICRLGRGPIRGYQPEYSQYGSFLQAHFTWLASLLAYILIILSAMQVGLGNTILQGNETFQAASYGFTIFSIVGPLAAINFIFAVFLIVFVNNWISTSKYEKKRLNKLAELGIAA